MQRSRRDSNSERRSEQNPELIISQLEPRQLAELGEGRRRNEFHPDEHPEGNQSSAHRPQKEEVGRPDIEYQGLKIDLSLKEWVVVGIVAVILAILLR